MSPFKTPPGPVFPFQPNHVQTTTLLTLLLLFLNALPHQRLLRLFQPQSKSRLPRPHASPFPGDAERLHIPSLVELILSQPRVGTTIKTGVDAGEEGEEGDPYAVLSVVNANVHLQQGNGPAGGG